MASLPLPRRAVHPLFLRKLANEKAPGASGYLGDLTTAQVVQHFVRPATGQAKSSFAECILGGQVPTKFALPWCSSGNIRDAEGGQQQAFGPTRYFVSHAWSYKFEALVSMIENHYAQLPGTRGGAKFLPLYYWVDILAVRQHFTGDFKDHPDSDFQGVIRCSRAVLFTMHPWRSPIAPTRVWCLFEALTAIQAPGVGFEVVVDVKDSKDTRVQTLQVISNSIEVRTAQATVSSDKVWILSKVEQGIGIAAFNNAIRKRLKEALLAAVTPNAVEAGDTQALHELLKVGGCVRPDGILDLAAHFRFASESDMALVLRSVLLRDLRPRGLAAAGMRRTREVLLSDSGLRGWDGAGTGLREYGESETGRVMWSWVPVAPVICQAIAELLVMPPASSSSSSGPNSVSSTNGSSNAPNGGSGGSGSGSGGASRGIEELWISLRAPRPEDSRPPSGLSTSSSTPHLLTHMHPHASGAPAAAAAGPAAATAARAAARAAVSPHRRRLASAALALSTAASAACSIAAACAASGGRCPSTTRARALTTVSIASSSSGPASAPGSSRTSTLTLTPSNSAGSLSSSLGRSGAPSAAGHSSSSLSGGHAPAYARRSVAGVLTPTPPCHAATTPSMRSPRLSLNDQGGYHPLLEPLTSPGGFAGVSGAAAAAAAAGSAWSLAAPASGALCGSLSGQQQQQVPGPSLQGWMQQMQAGEGGRVVLPPGRPALWVAVGASRTLRMLCLHCAVLGPQDVQLLGAALQASKTLEVLQAVKCVPLGGGEAAAGSSGAARLSCELLALGLGLPASCSLRQLHVRPGELAYVEEADLPAPQISNCPLKRITLAPVALSPSAVRQLGAALAPLPQLGSLVVGMDPAPAPSWMPKEQHDKELWLAHEDKNEPDMATKRRKHLGLDSEGQAAYVSYAWDFREDLAGLPDPDRGPAVLRQRAAALSFYLALSAGWRDMAQYARQYARWAWMRKPGADDASLANFKKSFETYKALATELLQASPDVFKLKFGSAEQRRRSEKSRLQTTYWETYC